MLNWLQHLLASYGYLAVALIVMAEGAGIPFPGETVLLLGAAYAGAGNLDLRGVILAAGLGAIAGDNLGYWIGRRGGAALLVRYGSLLRIGPQHLARAEGFFARHGAKTVLFARFIAVLRTVCSLLAGANRMPYRRFVVFNAAGGTLWSVTIGLLGAAFGSQWPRLEHWVGRAGLLVALILLLVALAALAGRWAVRHEERLRALGAPITRRLATPIGFLAARLSPKGYLGLQLTIGVILIMLGGWLFGGVAEDVVHGDPLVEVDRTVALFLHAHAAPHFTMLMKAVSLCGAPATVLVASLALAIYFGMRRRWTDLWMVGLAVGGGELLNPLLKVIFARQRPSFTDPLVTLTSNSFPSGHATGSTIFYGLVAYLIARRVKGWTWRVLSVVAAVVVVLLIGFSRIYLGAHYLSDVMGGVGVGLVWLASVVTGIETLRRRREELDAVEQGSPPAPLPASADAATPGG
jgi:membrane protein DedA with SNARE-associated domain/membrane-associated phospholipid phosphatase